MMEFSAFDRGTPDQKVGYVTDLFRRAETPQQFVAAMRYWERLRPQLEGQAKQAQCSDTGAAHDRAIGQDIAVGIFEEIAKLKNVGEIVTSLKIIVALTEHDAEDVVKELKALAVDLGKIGLEKGAEHIAEKAYQIYLQKYSERTRLVLRHFVQRLYQRSGRFADTLVRSVGQSLVTAGKIAGRAASAFLLASAPSRITPDVCVLIGFVENEAQEAFRRIARAPSLARPMAPLPMPPSGPGLTLR